MSKKPTASNTASRAVLREQFDQEKTFEQALAHVQSELGPASMTSKSGKYWWKEFGKGKRSLGANISTRDFQLAADSSLLKNKRALQCSLPVDYCSHTHASNGRFFIVTHNGDPFLFDSFHKQRRTLGYDASAAVAKDPDFPAVLFVSGLLAGHVFINETALLCKMYTQGGLKLRIVLARLDLQKATLCALSSVEVPMFVNGIQKVQEPVTFFCYTTGREVQKSAVLLTIAEDDSLSVGETINLPTELFVRSCAYKNGVVYSFDAAGSYCAVDPKMLRAYSLETQQTTVHKIKGPFEGMIAGHSTFWSNGVCLMYEHKKESKLNHLHEFRLDTMEWRDLGLRVPDSVQLLAALPREPLVVVTQRRKGGCMQFFYRFSHHRAKKLLDITWGAVVRRDEQEPGFAAKELEKLPPNLQLRCPWIPVYKAVEKRPLEPEENGEQAAGPSGLPPKQHKADASVEE